MRPICELDRSMTAPPLSGEPPTSLPLAACGLAHPGQQRARERGRVRQLRRRRGCSSSPTAWAATTRARSPARWRSTRSRASSARSTPTRARSGRTASIARCRWRANLLRVGIKVANDKIRAAAAADRARARMGATVVAMAVGETQLAIAHAGDSRAYRLRDGELKRLTRDHSIAEEMRAARPEMTDEELATFAHRNVVTRSLGSKDERRAGRLRQQAARRATSTCCAATGCGARSPTRRSRPSSRSTADLEAACQLLDRRRQRGRRARQHHGAAGARRLTPVTLADDDRGARRRQEGPRLRRARAASARPRPRPRWARWRRGAGSGRWCARSIRRRGWPTRWARAASAPSRSRCRPRPAARWASTARAGSCSRCASTPSATFAALVERAGRRSRDAAPHLRQHDLPADHDRC